MKIVKYFEKSSLLIKRVNKIIENETKEQKGGFLRMLLGTLSASLPRSLLIGKGVIQPGEEKNTAGQDFSSHLIL